MGQEHVARQLLRDGTRALPLAREDVLEHGDGDARHADAEVLVEPRILGRDDRIAQQRRDLFVADDDAALGGELADGPAVAREDARDRVRTVIVERADFGDVAGKGDEHTRHRAEQRCDDKQQDEARLRDPKRDAAPRFAGGILRFH